MHLKNIRSMVEHLVQTSRLLYVYRMVNNLVMHKILFFVSDTAEHEVYIR
jgi:hypothetical protein